MADETKKPICLARVDRRCSYIKFWQEVCSKTREETCPEKQKLIDDIKRNVEAAKNA